jgi:gas vesicle protein
MNIRSPWFAAGFLAGCAMGGALALLYAPMPGRALMQAIRDHVNRAVEESREAGQRAEADVLTRYRAIRSASVPGQVALTSTSSGQPSLGAPA